MKLFTTILIFLFIGINSIAYGFTDYSEAGLKKLISKMSLQQKVAQMIMIDLRAQKTHEEKLKTALEQVKEFNPGGICLFRSDLQDIDDVIDLTHMIQKTARIPLFVAVDQEGGRVTRLAQGTNMPGNMALGATGSERLARESAKILGKEIKILGMNINFAPDLDVNVNPYNPVIGIRSFGEDPHEVAKLGVAYTQGLHDARVIATGKHFPGHGDTSKDSHLELPTILHGRKRVFDVELVPFKVAIKNKIDMIMTAHVTFPKIDPTKVISKKTGKKINLPATLSKKILSQLLRRELGFEGVIVTDAFNMKAIADNFGEIQATIMAINAGADIILMPSSTRDTLKAVCDAVTKGTISENQIDQSVKRIFKLKAKYRLLTYNESDKDVKLRKTNAKELINSRLNQAMEKYISEKAVTLIRDNKKIIPFSVLKARHLLLAPSEKVRKMMHAAAEKIIETQSLKESGKASLVSFRYDSEKDWKQIWQSIGKSDDIIIGTYNLGRGKSGKKAAVKVNMILEMIAETSAKAVVMVVKAPYDPMFLPKKTACIAVYGSDKGPNIAAGINAIFGMCRITGKLPVTIPNVKNIYSEESRRRKSVVRLGIDNIDDYLELFKGKRVGLVTNQSGIDSELKSTIDVLNEKIKLTALFAPEHGIRGVAQAGDKVGDEKDLKTGLKVYSLYGKSRKPTKEMLENVDVLIYDMQDVGARFYTYINTMALCMEACAELGKKFIVLDRPNPISGVIQGNILDMKHKSFVGKYPIPQRYGLTIGEFAKYVNKTFNVNADLTVIPLKGWTRDMYYQDTGLATWVLPSPNMPTIDTAIVYTGTCVFEGTNLSEGRGTTRPFELIGAPWIDGLKLAEKLNSLGLSGVKFRAASFKPSFSKHKGKGCQGIQLHITDKHTFNSVKTGIAMLYTIKEMYPEHFEYLKTDFINKLVGNSYVKEGKFNLNQIFKKIDQDTEKFKKTIKEFLIY